MDTQYKIEERKSEESDQEEGEQEDKVEDKEEEAKEEVSMKVPKLSNPNFKLFQAFERSSLSIEKTINSLNTTLDESKLFLGELDQDEQNFMKLLGELEDDQLYKDDSDVPNFGDLEKRDK